MDKMNQLKDLLRHEINDLLLRPRNRLLKRCLP